jgi:hypothetical protein
MKMTGLAQRTISSTAVAASGLKLPCHRSRSPGLSVSATSPWLMALRVV